MEKLVKIKKITKLPKKYNRYDLTVSTTNNFYANGVLIHNTSAIVAKVKVKIPIRLKFHEWVWNLMCSNPILRKYKVKDYVEEYGPIFSSRKVIQNQYINKHKPTNKNLYKRDIWSEYGELIYPFLDEGMTLYGEIVGYVTDSEKMIQKGYDYGCEVGENKMMPYRITTRQSDGSIFEWNVDDVYNWTLKLIKEHEELKDRIMPIDILYHGTLGYAYPEVDREKHWHENVLEAMKNDSIRLGMELLEPKCLNAVPREGVVLRIDNDVVSEAFKLKCVAFRDREDKAVSNGEVDMEMEENAEA